MSVRIAVTETINAYRDMPADVAGLPALAERLHDVRQANIDHHVELIAMAAAEGAKVVGLGELFSAPYFALTKLPMWRALAEDAREGPTAAAMRRTAKQHGVIVIAPIYEKTDRGDRFNTAVVIDERGDVLGCFRKAHIPQGSNEKGTFSERFYYDASDGEMLVTSANVSPHKFFPVFTTSVGRIGVAICYDRHFEGVMRSLADGGAQIVFSPAVTFGDKSQRMWRQEFATDAARHNLYIAGSNRFGIEPPWNTAYYGDSHVVGPNGEATNLSKDPRVVIADVDLAALGETDPSGWQLKTDWRGDIYAPTRR